VKPAASRRVSFSVFCSKDLPVTFVFAPPAPVPLLMMAGVGAGASRFSPAMFIFCFSFFGLGVGAVVFGVDGGVFWTCSSTFSMMMMMMLIRDIAYYIYFNFLILLIE